MKQIQGGSEKLTHFVSMWRRSVWNNAKQGSGVGAGVRVGVARSRGNEPGVGVVVGIDQTASSPTLERFV